MSFGGSKGNQTQQPVANLPGADDQNDPVLVGGRYQFYPEPKTAEGPAPPEYASKSEWDKWLYPQGVPSKYGITSDPGTMDYYQKWAKVLNMDIQGLDMSDPQTQLFFNRTMIQHGFRPGTRPPTYVYIPPPSGGPAQPSPLPEAIPQHPGLREPPGKPSLDPGIQAGQGPKIQKLYKKEGKTMKQLDPMASPPETFKRLDRLKELEISPLQASILSRASPAELEFLRKLLIS